MDSTASSSGARKIWAQKLGIDPSYLCELHKPSSSLSFCFLICQMGTPNSACLPELTGGFSNLRPLVLSTGSWSSPHMGHRKDTGHP